MRGAVGVQRMAVWYGIAGIFRQRWGSRRERRNPKWRFDCLGAYKSSCRHPPRFFHYVTSATTTNGLLVRLGCVSGKRGSKQLCLNGGSAASCTCLGPSSQR